MRRRGIGRFDLLLLGIVPPNEAAAGCNSREELKRLWCSSQTRDLLLHHKGSRGFLGRPRAIKEVMMRVRPARGCSSGPKYRGS